MADRKSKHDAIMNLRPLYKAYTESPYYEAFEPLIDEGFDDFDRAGARNYARSMSNEEYDGLLDWSK
jgi:hypothetical protein